MRVLVTGSSGLVGSALVPFLNSGGHRVTRLVRSKPRAAEAYALWDPEAGTIDASSLEGLDAVVHLAGESIAAGRWTAARKARILESRVKGTNLLTGTLAGLSQPPKVLVSASAVGFYGDRGEEVLREESSSGSGFLAEVCRQWEAATAPAAQVGIRVVHLRFGMILSAKGGALQKLLLPFRFGLGGRLGSGRQFMSWVALDDIVGAIHHALTTEELQGPVNAVSPTAVRNAEFTRTLGRVLRRPAVFPLPAFAARLAFGQMADELLLASQRVEPARLLASSYQFRFPELEAALKHLLGKAG
jgi:uncharacterized protein (TIGR01777 family)